jgi:membrane-associated PAP2 superfamily phosphatase
MENQRKILGIVFILGGALIILMLSAGIALLYAIPFKEVANSKHFFPDFVMLISFTSSLLLISLLGIPSLIVGAGLLRHKQWSFDWILVIGCFYLILFPLGTAIGIYAFVVYFGNKKYSAQNREIEHAKAVQ